MILNCFLDRDKIQKAEKTGLELWHYEAWTDTQKEYVKDTQGG